MQTRIDLPDELITEVMQILGYKSKSETIVYSLKEVIRHKKLENLANWNEAIEIDVDLKKSRRRD